LGEQVQATFGEAYGCISLYYSREGVPLRTAGDLRLALPNLDSIPVLVMNGDAFCAMGLVGFYAWYRDRCALATVVLVRVNYAAPYGWVQIDAEGAVVHFAEKSGQSAMA